MAALTFGGQNIRTTGGIFFDLVAGYFDPPEVRGSDDIIPSTAGRTVRNRVKDRRRIVLEGYVQGSTAAVWRANMDTLFGVMLPTTPANLVIADNYLGTTGTKTISARFINAIGDTPIAGPIFQRWTIELESVAPDWS